MHKLFAFLWRPLSAVLLGLALVSCGPSTSTPSTNPISTLLAGTAAIGQPVSGANITLTDATGATRTTTTSSSGAYSIDVSGMTPPFVLVARGVANSNNVIMVSMIPSVQSSTSNVVNITPLTTAIAAMLSSDGKAVDLNPVTDGSTITARYATIDSYVVSQIAPTLTDAGLSSSADPVTTPFTADGTGYDSVYDNLQVGETSQGGIELAPSNSQSSSGPLCSPNQISQCNPVYSDPGDQTTTNPNACGSDIATGAPIPCDPQLPVTTNPPSGVLPLISGGGAGSLALGCYGCVFFGASDMPPPTNPLNITTVVPATSGALPGFPSGLPSSGTYQLSGQVCGTGIGCSSLPTETFSGVDPNTLEQDINQAIQATAASAGSSGCGESDSFTSWNGSSFTATITITCSSGGQSATVTETLTVTQIG